MWVRLLSIQNITQRGKLVRFNPGDWVDIGRQTAMLWISQGAAEIPNPERWGKFAISGGAGVRILSNAEGALQHPILDPFRKNLEISIGAPELPYERTMLWSPALKLRRELIPTGFSLLDTWQIAIPLQDYKRLACHVGGEEEQERTREVIRDLRVPLYDTRLMFIKKCEETERLLETWRADEGDPSLSFLRALYTTKPLVLALPPTWTDHRAR
jgi:hypothetical protein